MTPVTVFRVAKAAKTSILAGAALLAGLTGAGTARAETIWVNWNDFTAGSTSTAQFGSNDQLCTDPAHGANDNGYANAFTAIGTKFLRLHNAGLVTAWTNATTQTWDQAKIAAEYNAPYIVAVDGANIIQTIPAVPAWCKNTDGTVNADSYAAFCAQLVTIVNTNLGKHVKYWEPMNEWENNLFKNNVAGECAVYNKCAVAMKAADPTIKVGGPVASWAYTSLVTTFLNTCWSNVDFISWHHYMASASNTSGDAGIYASAMQNISHLDTDVTNINSAIASARAQHTDGRQFLLVMDELNIPASWTLTGWKQDQYVGAAFFASALKHLTADKVDILTNWSAKDGVYGLLDMHDVWRPAATVYQWANTALVGQIAANGSDNADCECLPIYRGASASGDKHSFLLVNKSASSKSIILLHHLPVNQTAHLTLIDSGGVHAPNTATITTTNPTFTLGGFSCELITMP